MLKKNDNLTYMYIYDNENDSNIGVPSDSLCLYNDSTYEQSLNLYKNTDSICKTIHGFLFFTVFKLNNEKFAIISDSTTTKIYKFNSSEFKRLYLIPDIGVDEPTVIMENQDINSDGYTDIVVHIPNAGCRGDVYVCLFYNPELKTLIYDNKVSLYDLEFYPKEKKVISTYYKTSSIYIIENYSFKFLKEIVIE